MIDNDLADGQANFMKKDSILNRITRERMTRWRIGNTYALRCEKGDWYEYPKKFPVYLIDRSGYLFFETEEKLLNNPCVVVNPRENRNSLIRFSKGLGTGHCSISKLPGYIYVKE
jgi:hypothetical protein